MKLVKEHINEVLSFKRDQENSLVNLGVGKVSLIKKWLDKMEVTNYVINDDLTINVIGNVYLSDKNLVKFPDFIKFNKVEGGFTCSCNQLTSLKGCPTYVFKGFSCSDNKLTSLDGCPSYVDIDFWCYDNKKQFTKDEVMQLCNEKGKIYV